MPKLSVIITSHDRWPLLYLAVESVLCQTFRDLELIIVDDKSTDENVIKLLDDVFKIKKPMVNVLRVKHDDKFRSTHKMVAVLINQGLDVARGDYISYLCDDDVFLPYRCKRMVKVLDNSSFDMVVDRVRWVSWTGVRMDQAAIGNYNYPQPFLPGHEGLVKILKSSGCNFICHDSVMHKKTDLRWPIDLNYPPVDWRFWLKLYQAGFKIKVLRNVGEEAYLPGMWRRGITMDQAISAKTFGGSIVMKKIIYARNTSKKVQIAKGGLIEVEPGGRIEASKVTSASGALLPNFVYDDISVSVPSVRKDKKKDKLVVDEPLVSDKPVVKKVPFEIKEREKEIKENMETIEDNKQDVIDLNTSVFDKSVVSNLEKVVDEEQKVALEIQPQFPSYDGEIDKSIVTGIEVEESKDEKKSKRKGGRRKTSGRTYKSKTSKKVKKSARKKSSRKRSKKSSKKRSDWDSVT